MKVTSRSDLPEAAFGLNCILKQTSVFLQIKPIPSLRVDLACYFLHNLQRACDFLRSVEPVLEQNLVGAMRNDYIRKAKLDSELQRAKVYCARAIPIEG